MREPSRFVVIWIVPPTSAARSRMDDRPTPGTQEPTVDPVSLTLTSRQPSWCWICTRAWSVPLCRAELITASVVIRKAATLDSGRQRRKVGRLHPHVHRVSLGGLQ